MVTTQLFQFQFHNPFRIDSPLPQTNPNFLTRRNNINGRFRCTRSGDRETGSSRWYSDDTNRSKRFDFNLDDDDGAFGYKSATRKRNWWSGDDEDEDEEDEDDEFGVLEDSINGIALITKICNQSKNTIWRQIGHGHGRHSSLLAIALWRVNMPMVLRSLITFAAPVWCVSLGFKDFSVEEDDITALVIKAFGWMVPAIMISMIVGTGPNAFFMALALPLAQTAFSLVVDAISGTPKNNTRYKPRTKGRRRPFARAASNVGTDKEKERTTGNKGEKSSSKFGGWDELDEQGGTGRDSFMNQTRNAEEEKSQPKKGKLSRRVRKREKPLVLRLLIAVFPFLGSWTRFL